MNAENWAIRIGVAVLIIVAIGAVAAGYWSEHRPFVRDGGLRKGGQNEIVGSPVRPKETLEVQVTIGSHRSVPINELPRGDYKVLAILEGPEGGATASIYFLIEDAVGEQVLARITRGPEVARWLSGREVVAIMAGASPWEERPGSVSFIFADRTYVTMEPTN